MSHEKHHTEAIVLGDVASGDKDKFFYLLTKDFGHIITHGRSVRGADSKLRFTLQKFSLIHADLIHGRGGWRIASAEPISNFFYEAGGSHHFFSVAERASSLLRRLLKGEEKNELLFIDVCAGFGALSRHASSREDAHMVEIMFVMRILHHLGYFGEDILLSPFLAGDMNDPAHFARMKREKARAIEAINKSLAATQL